MGRRVSITRSPVQRSTPHTNLVIHGLEVLLEIVDRVCRTDDDLAHRIPADEGRKTTQRLFTRSTNTHQQGVATIIEHNANDACNLVRYTIGEKILMLVLSYSHKRLVEIVGRTIIAWVWSTYNLLTPPLVSSFNVPCRFVNHELEYPSQR